MTDCDCKPFTASGIATVLKKNGPGFADQKLKKLLEVTHSK